MLLYSSNTWFGYCQCTNPVYKYFCFPWKCSLKIIFDEKYGELLGCHIIGANATDLISEISLARDLETTYNEIINSVHPHPTLSEAIMEATADALGEAIHI